MPIKNIRHPGNDTYYGKITSLDEDEKKVLSEVGMVSESNFDSTLFSVDTNGKISLSNIYNDYGVLSILSDENYAIDLHEKSYRSNKVVLNNEISTIYGKGMNI